ncbi:uncharacterized protein K460DRAFT_409422 [Cucurbitaria berberidis CBS 394.84]|uniref:BTB domain-containing protein n=1 Tax=Cucurbitaria berberidis CBS 394.84 TaxID=1168544 RepID=A0A9P4GA42_9PLEO|nr:uncharacterized protein K460DRAFT_409422 [Cucurbitaria berberidis CBS 394.84]KAF1841983.1 hypothetical protein K460DRAFT_409422 [Cucurbitaria berberidis CBS 394.84]
MKTLQPKMAAATQQPTPSSSSSNNMPPPPSKVPASPPNANKPTHSDMFLEMIQGPAITVIVGPDPTARQYTLPKAIIGVHSLYFRNEIARLNSLHASTNANKKRKRSSNIEETTLKEEEGEGETSKAMDETSEKRDLVIRLPDVDAVIFGLFLKYIYQGSYPASVDSVSSTMHRVSPLTPTTTITPSRHPPYSSVPQTQTHTPPARTPNQSHIPVSQSLSPHRTAQSNPIPPSIRAWLLAQRLGAMGFMNHAMSRIFGGIGCHFALTPSLLHYVWAETSPPSLANAPTSTTAAPSTSISSAPDMLRAPNAVLTPSPLRKLLLDVLVLQWPSQATHIIAKSPGLNATWNALFDAHLDLRREFIFGLQGGGNLMPVQGYFASASAAPVAVGQGSLGQGEGQSAVAKKGGEGDGEAGCGRVVVKKEGDAGAEGEVKSA